jgi:hypothetical protein
MLTLKNQTLLFVLRPTVMVGLFFCLIMNLRYGLGRLTYFGLWTILVLGKFSCCYRGGSQHKGTKAQSSQKFAKFAKFAKFVYAQFRGRGTSASKPK